MKQCLRTLVLLIRRLWDVFTVKRRTSTPLFELHGHVRVHFRTQFLIASPNATCLYKLYQLWDVTTCNLSLKRRFSAPFWLTRTSSCENFHIEGRVCMQLVTYFPMFYPDYHVSTQMCHLRDVFICVHSHTKKTYVYALCDLRRHINV